jgi:hypothetical protein
MAAAAKVTIAGVSVAAIVFQAWLGARGWPLLFPLVIVSMPAGFLLCRRWPAIAWAGVALPVAVLPVIFFATTGAFFNEYHGLWFGFILGVVCAASPVTRWAIHGWMKIPLASWALGIALTLPVVLWREADFSWSTFSQYYHASNSGAGGPAPIVAIFIIEIALMQMLGVLLFDAFFALSPTLDERRFRRLVIWPFAVSVLAGSAIALYQGLVDVYWWNGHLWPGANRAGGGLVDGDAFGALAGFWSIAIFAAADTPAATAAACVIAVFCLGALWATGSRMALLAALIGYGSTMLASFRLRSWRNRVMVLGSAVVLAAVVSAIGLSMPTTGPIGRIKKSLPDPSWKAVTAFAKNELFDRGAPFGTVSVELIATYPVAGVGVGCFEHLFPDYAYRIDQFRRPVENAQSWYRHQLAELGVLGSAGWLVWFAAFGWWVLRTRAEGRAGLRLAAIRGALIAIAVVSIVSMPTRNPASGITFWPMAFWFVAIAGPAAWSRVSAEWNASRLSIAWTATWMIAISAAGVTAWQARQDLRPPFRALLADWRYERGVYPVEHDAGGDFWWTSQESVLTRETKSGYLKLDMWLGHPDIAARPVRVRLWVRERLVDDVEVSSGEHIVRYVWIPDGTKNLMISTKVSRTWDPGYGTPHPLGLAMRDWTYVSEPPPGSVVLK